MTGYTPPEPNEATLELESYTPPARNEATIDLSHVMYRRAETFTDTISVDSTRSVQRTRSATVYASTITAESDRTLHRESDTYVDRLAREAAANPYGLEAVAATPTSISLEWVDTADHEIGWRIWRSRVTDDEITSSEIIAELGKDTDSYTDDTVVPDATYRYTVEAVFPTSVLVSPPADGDSDSLELRAQAIPSRGPYVEIDVNDE